MPGIEIIVLKPLTVTSQLSDEGYSGRLPRLCYTSPKYFQKLKLSEIREMTSEMLTWASQHLCRSFCGVTVDGIIGWFYAEAFSCTYQDWAKTFFDVWDPAITTEISLCLHSFHVRVVRKSLYESRMTRDIFVKCPHYGERAFDILILYQTSVWPGSYGDVLHLKLGIWEIITRNGNKSIRDSKNTPQNSLSTEYTVC